MRRIVFLILFFLGCSEKFEPKVAINKPLKKQDYAILQDYTKNTLTFKKYIFKKSSVEKVYYDENNTYLGKFIKINTNLAKNGNRLYLIKEKKEIKLPYLIATATKKNNLIAIVFNNNAVGIYDLDKHNLTFYIQNEPLLAVKYLKSQPLFYKDLVLFPLLNSKVLVYDLTNHKVANIIDLNDNNLINNIIFMKIIKNKLFIATSNKLILYKAIPIEYKANIKHIVNLGDYLYLFLVGGDVVKLDSNLKEIKRISLLFADFFAPSICKGYIYTISDNYLIKISKDLKVTVYKGNEFSLPLKIKGCKIYTAGEVYFIE